MKKHSPEQESGRPSHSGLVGWEGPQAEFLRLPLWWALSYIPLLSLTLCFQLLQEPFCCISPHKLCREKLSIFILNLPPLEEKVQDFPNKAES